MANKYLEELLKKNNINLGKNDEENILKWNELMINKKSSEWTPEDIELESKYLKTELLKHKPVNIYELLSLIPVTNYEDIIYFYNGDLASIFIDAIAIPIADKQGDKKNKQHIVYYYNGINLLKKLDISREVEDVKDGEVIITRSYNIPSDFIIHVKYDYKNIETCIINILECSRVNMVKSLLIDIDMNDISLYKETYDAICKYLDTYKDMFDKILIYVNPTVNIQELEKELS